MAQDDAQEKTEQPTPKRLKEAKEKGQIPRSRELNTMMMLVIAGIGLILMGDKMGGDLAAMVKRQLTFPREMVFETRYLVPAFYSAMLDAVQLLAPFLLLMVVVALLAPVMLGGWTVSSLSFKWEKVDPVKGLKRVFGANGLMEMVKALAKFVIVASVAVLLLYMLWERFVSFGDEPLNQAIAHSASLIGWSFLLVSAATAFIAAVDVPFQIWQHSKQLRMSTQEIKDEMKETDGKPEVKSKIRQIQQQIAQGRMMSDVPKADVVITNPTHFAVALKYDEGSMGAPVVVALGADEIAAQIRRIANETDVPIYAAPPLARALYYSTEIGQEIPAGLYVAAAQILAYIFRLRTVKRRGGAVPKPPRELPVPTEYEAMSRKKRRH
jgi:flagellar biosynthetic protein FlhB